MHHFYSNFSGDLNDVHPVLSSEKIYVSKEKGRGQNNVEELKTNRKISTHFRYI